jgi:hypothetical protein
MLVRAEWAPMKPQHNQDDKNTHHLPSFPMPLGNLSLPSTTPSPARPPDNHWATTPTTGEHTHLQLCINGPAQYMLSFVWLLLLSIITWDSVVLQRVVLQHVVLQHVVLAESLLWPSSVALHGYHSPQGRPLWMVLCRHVSSCGSYFTNVVRKYKICILKSITHCLGN